MMYFFGFLAIVLGVLIVLKTEWIVENFGTSDWAEQHMGTSGGSRLMYKLIGVAIIFGSMMVMTGMMGEIILGVFGSLFGIQQ